MSTDTKSPDMLILTNFSGEKKKIESKGAKIVPFHLRVARCGKRGTVITVLCVPLPLSPSFLSSLNGATPHSGQVQTIDALHRKSSKRKGDGRGAPSTGAVLLHALFRAHFSAPICAALPRYETYSPLSGRSYELTRLGPVRPCVRLCQPVRTSDNRFEQGFLADSVRL